MNQHTARGARGSRSPGSAISRRLRVLPGGWRAEILAGAVLTVLSVTIAICWWAAPADRAAALSTPGAAGDTEPYQFTTTALPTGGLTAATALILGGLIFGAVLVGRIFYSPTRKRR